MGWWVGDQRVKGWCGDKGGGRGVTKEVELIKQRDSLVVKHYNFLWQRRLFFPPLFYGVETSNSPGMNQS